ncbi:MAG TPA: M48 family metallopeptidase [Gemmatimonadales bacterium]|nr:M48 family metallopeptidase [Gemmatimonadales bacterium]
MPDPTPLAVRYYRSGNVLWAVGTGLSLLLPALLLYTGWSARMRSTAVRLGRSWLASLMVYALLFTAISAILGLPLAYYEGFVRQHAYGLSNQSLSKWAGDWLKGVGLSGLGLALVLWIPYLLLRRSPRRWWLYAGLASAPIATFLLIVAPVWIDPLFNHFGPMKDRVLEQRILQLAERAGIPGSRVYQVDKSVDTKTVNAYVTGVGATKRIVLWDTILEKLDADQVAFVTGHEMGHFVLGHVAALIGVITVLTTLSLYVVHRVAGRLIARFSGRFGFDRLSDFASLPLLLLLSTVVSLITTPLVLAYTRHQEHEADRFGLELTRDNHAAATTFVRLQQENLAIPRPGALYRLWRGSHPSLGDRVDFANRYRPWETGGQLRYGELFR